VSDGNRFTIHFSKAAPALQPYISTYHMMAQSQGSETCDCLAPEWAVLRVSHHGGWEWAETGDTRVKAPRVSLTGQLSKAMHLYGCGHKFVGIGIVPLGWAALIGVDASKYADRMVDVEAEPELAHLLPLAEAMAAVSDEKQMNAALDAEIARIVKPVRDADTIVAINESLLDPSMNSAGDLATRVDLSPPQLARLATRVFGFPPQKLLKRQRFLRTLGRVLLEPDLSWIETLDPAYYDQAQFSHDFREAMGMSPRDYLAMPHPLIQAAAIARAKAIGGPLQGLHRPAWSLRP
jgi:AraC-like DNA-binding protein